MGVVPEHGMDKAGLELASAFPIKVLPINSVVGRNCPENAANTQPQSTR